MKKFLLIMTAIMFASNIALADFTGPSSYSVNQGFQSSTPDSMSSVGSVKDVMGMYDDQIAVVKGKITKRISEDKYLFKDKTGEMVVEIDYKYWGGLQVNEKDTLELTGKVDKDYNSVVLDVFSVKKAK